MRVMKYFKKTQCIVLHKGNYKGFDFFIFNLGIHPTAYVRIPKEHKYYKKDYMDIDIDIECHHGLTFSADDFCYNPIVLENSWWIGWDYGHSGDYAGYYEQDTFFDKNSKNSKKWTTEEIFEEVKKVIEQLK